MKYPKLLPVIILMIGNIVAFAQQDALNTQYVMNKLFINPAYAGYKEQPNFTLMSRKQWAGFKGAPTTAVISFDSPLEKDELAGGGTLLFDKLGPISKLGLSVDFAYRARLTNKATLAFGAKGTMELYQANLTDLYLTSDYYGTQDEAFSYNIKNLFLPNIGFGIFYSKKDHYIGLSVPKMLRPKLEKRNSTGYELLSGRQEPTYILSAGKYWKLNKKFKVQPNFVLRGVWGAPVSLGLYVNAIYLDQFTGGFYSYIGENAGVLFQWQVNKQFRIGYSFDVATNTLIRTNYGSHELALGFVMSTRKKRIIYPRYF